MERRLQDAQREVDQTTRGRRQAIDHRARVIAEARDRHRMSLREIARALETNESRWTTSRVNGVLAGGYPSAEGAA